MAVNYTIEADIIDIQVDIPNTLDHFLIDTNVWYWMTYTKAAQSARAYQISAYPNYTNLALANNSKIFHSGLSLSEMSHLIERTEYRIFASSNPETFSDPAKFDKNFRFSHQQERAQAILEIQASWSQVESLAESLPLSIDSISTSAALSNLNLCKVDGYDLFILEAMKSNSINQIITDDGDFASVPGIKVFTANKNVINAAKAQKKLISR